MADYPTPLLKRMKSNRITCIQFTGNDSDNWERIARENEYYILRSEANELNEHCEGLILLKVKRTLKVLIALSKGIILQN